MKELYFTDENLKSVSSNIIKEISKYQRNKRIPFFPQKSALLILDMQDFFLNHQSHAFIPSAPVIVGNIKSLLTAYLNNNYPVIFTRHSNTSRNAKMMKKWWGRLINSEQKESEIIDSLYTADSKIITKTQYEAFYNTELYDYL
ncbi:MAG: isochorismatase family protein, partial [bacterium]